jgi:hypothetical protein
MPKSRMPKTDDFADTFAKLRGLLQRHGRGLIVTVDEPGAFQLASSTQTDRVGRPLSVAAVQIKKNYVSFHLMPIYADAALLAEASPELRKRMQGKACFNFDAIEPDQVKELSALTKKGIERFRRVKLPWAAPGK